MKNKPLKLSKKILFIAVAIAAVAISVVLIFALKGGGNEYPDKISTLEQLNDEGKYEEAQKAANDILDMNPGNDTKADALWELSIAESAQARSYQEQGQTDMAQEKFNKAIEHAKSMQELDSPGSHYLLGLIYIDKADYKNAIQELTLAKQQSPYLKDEVDQYLTPLQEMVN